VVEEGTLSHVLIMGNESMSFILLPQGLFWRCEIKWESLRGAMNTFTYDYIVHPQMSLENGSGEWTRHSR